MTVQMLLHGVRSNLVRRIGAGLGANAFGQGVTIAIQLISLPLFLSRWDATTYGVWLVISALPAYLSMADVGMVTTAGNQMTIAMGANKHTQAVATFHSAILFLAITCASVAAIVFPAIFLLPEILLVDWDQRLAIAALVMGVIISLFSGLLDAQFRATGRYAIGTLLGNVTRLLEFIGGMTGLWLFGSFTAVASGMLIARSLCFASVFLIAQKGDIAIRWGIAEARFSEVKNMFRPAIAFMVFPLTNALTFQGVTLAVAYMFGPAAVATFNTYRTLSRVSVQFSGIFSHAIWPEFSSRFGSGGVESVRSLYRRTAILGAIASLLLSVVIFFVSPWILKAWARGSIEFLPELMALLLTYAALGGIWHMPRVLLMSINCHERLAGWVMLSGLLVVPTALALGTLMGLNGIGVAMLIAEIVVALAAFVQVQKLLNSKPNGFGVQ
jgi:O-antigen/teichoic acid export membrane protein